MLKVSPIPTGDSKEVKSAPVPAPSKPVDLRTAPLPPCKPSPVIRVPLRRLFSGSGVTNIAVIEIIFVMSLERDGGRRKPLCLSYEYTHVLNLFKT